MRDAQIKAFWDARARERSHDDSEVTHRDVWQRWLEIETIRRHLARGDRLLDVGCGAGYTTRLVADCVRDALGIDSSGAMIERARAAAGDSPHLRFEAADVLALGPERFGRFDVVLSSRCLINLAGWDDQLRAIGNIASVLEPGGRFLFLEGLEDGRSRLNALREHSGLSAMPAVWHNVDFVEERLLRAIAPMFRVEERRHFGVYDFIARVVHPLVVAPEAPRYDARINEIGARLALDRQEFGDISRVIFLVLVRLEPTGQP
jgi:SAM-dependent methyltransferase